MKSEFKFEATGTHWQIDIANPLSESEKSKLFLKITSIIEGFEKTYSRFRKDSLISNISVNKGTYIFPEDAQELLEFYKKTYEITDHLFTPFIGDLLVESGYDSEYSLDPKEMHPPISWEEGFDYNHPFLKVKKPALLDFGAAGKGYIVDILSRFLEGINITEYIIDAGGDILYKNIGQKRLMVGLEHPNFPDQVIGIAGINNESICCSAGNRRKWKDFHHIINPQTLLSPMEVLSTWVIAKNTITADALATCLFLVPAQKLLSNFDFSYALILKDYSLEYSDDFPAEFFVQNKTNDENN